MVGYDTEPLERMRFAMADLPGVTERAMFGGVALMLDGNMCIGAMKGGGMMVRLSADEAESAVHEKHAREMDMTGRRMRGWVIVDDDGLASDEDLQAWVDRAVAFVRTLPAK